MNSYPGCVTIVPRTGTNLMAEFRKDDSGKIEYDMFPDEVLQEVIKVMMYGAKKYERDNWKKGNSPADQRRYYNASRRHDASDLAGELRDPESGLYHLAHKLCNDVFRLYFKIQEDKNVKSNTSNT